MFFKTVENTTHLKSPFTTYLTNKKRKRNYCFHPTHKGTEHKGTKTTQSNGLPKTTRLNPR